MSLSLNDPAVLEHLVATTGLREADPLIACQALAELAIGLGHNAKRWHGDVSRSAPFNTPVCAGSKIDQTTVYAVEIDGKRYIPALPMFPVKSFHFILVALRQTQTQQADYVVSAGPASAVLGWPDNHLEKWRPPKLLYCSNPIASGAQPWERLLGAAWEEMQSTGLSSLPLPCSRPDPLHGHHDHGVMADPRTEELMKLLVPHPMLSPDELAGRLAALAQDRQLPLQVVRREVQVPQDSHLWIGWQHILLIGSGTEMIMGALQSPGEWAGMEMHRARTGHKLELPFNESMAAVEPVRTLGGEGLDEDAVVAQVLGLSMDKVTPETDTAPTHMLRF